MFKARQFKRKKLFLIIFVILLIISAAGLFGYKVLTENKLTRFDVETQNLSCTSSEEITIFVQKKNINYFYFKAEPLENDLRKKFFCIGNIESEVSYPDRLKLKITGRSGKFIVNSINASIETNPAIALNPEQMDATQSSSEAFPPKVLKEILLAFKQASGSAFYLADEEGMVFEQVNPDVNFPRVSLFSQDLKIGQKIPNEIIQKVSQVKEKLKNIQAPSDNFIVVGEKLIIDSHPRIIFSLNKPLDRQTASLQLILAQAKMNLDPDRRDNRSVESIDLRFDRPVVVYSKK